MHQITTNNSFKVEVAQDGGGAEWECQLTFWTTPMMEEARERRGAGNMRHEIDTLDGIETVHIRVRDRSPEAVLARMWAVCDAWDYWRWNR